VGKGVEGGVMANQVNLIGALEAHINSVNQEIDRDEASLDKGRKRLAMYKAQKETEEMRIIEKSLRDELHAVNMELLGVKADAEFLARKLKEALDDAASLRSMIAGLRLVRR
jgi:predicted  nucleic acid-binding Zn-ribbon protein